MKKKSKSFATYFLTVFGTVATIEGLALALGSFYFDYTKQFLDHYGIPNLIITSFILIFIISYFIKDYFKSKYKEIEVQPVLLYISATFLLITSLIWLFKLDLIVVFLTAQFSIFFFGMHHFRKNQQKLEKREKGLIGFSLLFLVLLPFVCLLFMTPPVTTDCSDCTEAVDHTPIIEENEKNISGSWVLQGSGESLSNGVVIFIDKGVDIDGFYINNNIIINLEGEQDGKSITGNTYSMDMEVNGSFDLRQTTNKTFTGDVIINGDSIIWNAYLEDDFEKIREELSELPNTFEEDEKPEKTENENLANAGENRNNENDRETVEDNQASNVGWSIPSRPDHIKTGDTKYIYLGVIRNGIWTKSFFSKYKKRDKFEVSNIIKTLNLSESKKMDIYDIPAGASDYVSYVLELESISSTIDTIRKNNGTYSCWMKMEIVN